MPLVVQSQSNSSRAAYSVMRVRVLTQGHTRTGGLLSELQNGCPGALRAQLSPRDELAPRVLAQTTIDASAAAHSRLRFRHVPATVDRRQRGEHSEHARPEPRYP
jgi:hypothetical protein